jgi:aquaporin Z
MLAWNTLRAHWPEYLIEAWALGTFMVSAGLFTLAFEYPGSPVHAWMPDADIRRVCIGIAMGLTAIALIYSPWGKRSGAHMNPAVTLTFLRLGHLAHWDAVFYIIAQFVGGTLGVLVVSLMFGTAFAAPPVSSVVTIPGEPGTFVALLAEFIISFLMMAMVLELSSLPRLMRYTGLGAGALVALWISIEAPLSGMSMNPARSFASAAPSGIWTDFWIYVLAPIAGMQCAALFHARIRAAHETRMSCAKLVHSREQRCIFCNWTPHTSH